MEARKNLTVNHPVDRFHQLKQLISFPAISEVVFLFKICAAKEARHPSSDASAPVNEPLNAAGKSAGK